MQCFNREQFLRSRSRQLTQIYAEKVLNDKMFLTFLLSSFLLIQAFTSGFAVFPLYAEELGIAKHHLGVSSIGAGCSILLAAVWAKKEAFYVSFLFLGIFFSAVMSLPPLVILARFDKQVASFGNGIVLCVQSMATVLCFGISPLLQKQSGSWNAVLYYLAAALVMAGIINIVTTKVFPVTSHSCKD
ncbi:hypothetical protein EB796_019718 [Bugula neritina]|uniref:Uncharacterized protein n=1 Tax=Bugula neritina TaxID=10212 RepID=A0A7J7J6W1_BUGNE|nr:hypothetical protein EB796_019718 [Bugula neritina]